VPIVTVIRAGLLTTIQDRGRWGFQSRGVPTSGPMDLRSHRLANALVGNGPDSAALEITLTGPEIEFDDERVVAVAGAELAIDVDGRRQATHSPFTASAGARVRMGERTAGARAYLAVAGGFDVPPVLGSRATHIVSRMGGLDGRALTAGDRIPLGRVPDRPPVAAAAPMPLPVPGEATRLRVLPGPHADRFAAGALDVLQSAPYTVTAQSDRMGFRLEGPRLTHAGAADIVSDATPLGVLQVPASGQPVILMADRQTTGGYANLATIISADIGLAGQLAPGDQIRFEVSTLAGAMAALIKQEQLLMAIEQGVR
jgi:antagonist of KipI